MLREALTSDPIHSELMEKVSMKDALKDKVLQRSTSLQVSVFTLCSFCSLFGLVSIRSVLGFDIVFLD